MKDKFISNTKLAEDLANSLDPSRSSVVHACAGSGKTWLLTSRIIRIMLHEPNLSLNSILAITFTKNAAAEIESRIRERLYEMAKVNDEQLATILTGIVADTNDLQQARGLYRRYILAQPSFSIYTFHSWFQHITQYLPWAARPSLTEAVASSQEMLKDQAWQETLQQTVTDESASKAFSYLIGVQKQSTIRLILDDVIDKRVDWFMHYGFAPEDEGSEQAFLARLDENIPKPDTQSSEELFASEEFIKKLKYLLSRFDGTSQKLLQKASDAFLDALELRNNPYEAHTKAWAGMFTGTGTVKIALLKAAKLDPILTDALNYMTLALIGAKEYMVWERLHKYNEMCACLGILFARCYAKIKKQKGVIDYSDMELTPLRTMTSNAVDGKANMSLEAIQEMLERMDARYSHILVDEFQDTSPVQWWMLHTWLEASAGSDNQPSVFIVGDPKQSIYGFRNGDPRLLTVAGKYLKDSEYKAFVAKNNATRRCSQPIVDFINEIFDSEKIKLAGFAKHETLTANKKGLVCKLSPAELEVPFDKVSSARIRNPLRDDAIDKKSSSAATKEGRIIADFIGGIVGKKYIQPSDEGPARLCTFDDVMILHPSRSGIEDVVNELSLRGLACMSPSGENRTKSLECKDMVALMHAIYDPAYGLMVAQTLRSPIFSVTEDDLWAVHVAGRKEAGRTCDWVKGLTKAKGSPQLERAKKLLTSWRKRYVSEKLPTHEMLSLCFYEADIVRRYVHTVAPKLRKRVVLNLQWVMNYCIEAEGGRLAQLSDYASYLGELRRSGEIIQTDETQKNVIRVMSIHGAKGLESPVVVITNSNFDIPADGAGLLINWDLETLAHGPSHVSFMRSPKELTKPQQIALDDQKLAREREVHNQLYVALTRAKSVVALSSRIRKKDSRIAWATLAGEIIESKLHGQKDKQDMLSFGDWTGNAPKNLDNQEEDTKSDQIELEQFKKLTFKVGTRTTTFQPWTRTGTLTHNLIALKLSGNEDKNFQRNYLGISTKEHTQINDIANTMIGKDSEFYKLLSGVYRIECEMSLVNASNKELRADCVVFTEKEIWIIDFKTSQKVDVVSYHDQLKSYMEVLETNFPKRKVRSALVDIDGKMLEVSRN